MEAVRTSEGWQRWLQVRCFLGNLDIRNQILVAYQRAGARKVATSRGWLRLGYEVRRDERAIRVWARLPASKSAIRDWEEAGSPPEEEPERAFRLVPVFDQDQVRRLSELSDVVEEEPPSGSSEASRLISLLGQLIKFASEIGAPVTFEPIASVVRSYHEPGTGAIVIDASADFPPTACAHRLVYELGNVLIDEDPCRQGLQLSDGDREVVAHSVAHCVWVCAGCALHVPPIAVPADWERGSALAVRYAALVDRVAGRLERALLSGMEGEPDERA